MKNKTVAEILNSCKLGDIVSDGIRTWEVVSADSESIVASPRNFPKDEDKFELWNCGAESIATIPNLKRRT